MGRFVTALTFALATGLPTFPALAEDINQDMIKAGSAMSDLIPYIYNDDRFREDRNHDFILQQLDRLITAIEAEPHLLRDHAVSRQISQASLLEQLKQARLLFNTGNYATSQYLLGNAPILCSSCHIQDGITARSAPTVKREVFANDFSYAEFNYYVRNYPVAEKAYRAYLDNIEVKHSRITGSKTLERLLDITLITDNDLEKSRTKLEAYRKIPDLDMELKRRITDWLKGIQELSPATLATTDIEPLIYAQFNDGFSLKHEFIFDETKRPLTLVWRAELQKRMQSTTDPGQIARNLYLISILERLLGDQNELSLANLYLKECIRLNVAVYSGKCMNEYEGHLYFYYGGSSGENMPDEAAQELAKLRKSLKKGI